MADTQPDPLEAILRYCAAAAPRPWYPSVFARETGTPRDSLDPFLDRLRMGGFIQLTEWVEGNGQGYALTPAGVELLQRPRQLARLRRGEQPSIRMADEAEEELELTGDPVREALLGIASPVMTQLLIYLNIAVFVAGLVLVYRDSPDGQVSERVGSYLGRSSPAILHQTGALSVTDVFVHHQWWRLLTCCFVHVGFLHLAMNMYSLYVVGPILEQMLGKWRFLIFYLLSGLCGSCGMLIEQADTPNVQGAGASGAIWGVMAGMVALVFVYRSLLPPGLYSHWQRQLLTVFLLNLFITFSVPHISKGGHFGGGIAGLLLAVPLDYLRVGRGLQRVLALAVIAVVPIFAVVWMVRTLENSLPLQELRGEQERLQFNAEELPAITQSIGEARKLYSELRNTLLGQHVSRRDQEKVKEALRKLAERRGTLAVVAQQLRAATPAHDRRVELVRQTAIEYLDGYDQLLALTEDCLNRGTPQDEKALLKQEEEVRSLRERWKNLPWG